MKNIWNNYCHLYKFKVQYNCVSSESVTNAFHRIFVIKVGFNESVEDSLILMD